MKRVGFVFALAVIALALSGSALAQGDGSYYFVTYFSNNAVSGAPDQTVRLVNDGETGGNLWADFYVFDDSEELSECCACVVTPDGLLSESVKTQLVANPLSGPIRKVGVIKVMSSSSASPISPSPTTGLRGWATHNQKLTTSTAFGITETPLADSNYSSYEAGALGTDLRHPAATRQRLRLLHLHTGRPRFLNVGLNWV